LVIWGGTDGCFEDRVFRPYRVRTLEIALIVGEQKETFGKHLLLQCPGSIIPGKTLVVLEIIVVWKYDGEGETINSFSILTFRPWNRNTWQS